MINKRKMRDEMLCFLGVIIGIIWFLLGITGTTPGMDGVVNKFVTICISIGFIGGLLLAGLSAFSFIKVRNTKYPRRRAR